MTSYCFREYVEICVGILHLTWCNNVIKTVEQTNRTFKERNYSQPHEVKYFSLQYIQKILNSKTLMFIKMTTRNVCTPQAPSIVFVY